MARKEFEIIVKGVMEKLPEEFKDKLQNTGKRLKDLGIY